MNRRLACGCHWTAGRAHVCPTADEIQRAIGAAEHAGNVILLQQAEQNLVQHWRDHGLTSREFYALVNRANTRRAP